MSVWIIEPRDPLIVRDGRPFGPDPGAAAQSLPFPFPSTVAGAVRARAGTDANGCFDDDETEITKLTDIAVRGPLLVTLSDAGSIDEWFAPAPNDAVVLDHQASQGAALHDAKRAISCVPLVPLSMPAGAVTNLDDGLHLVGMTARDPRKPVSPQPAWWRWAAFEAWLRDPNRSDTTLGDLGLSALPKDRRVHVGVDATTSTAEDGRLFQTSGLAFDGVIRATSNSPGDRTIRLEVVRQPAHRRRRDETSGTPGDRAMRLAMAVNTTGELVEGMFPIGGERRLARWAKLNEAALPELKPDIRERILNDRACRLVLLTSAVFAEGTYPTGFLKKGFDQPASLAAAAVPGYTVASGWDIMRRTPKPTRRLAPAGSVYWLTFGTREPEAAIERWIDGVWMQTISDEAKDRADGFGLAALGTWDGKTQPMEVGK